MGAMFVGQQFLQDVLAYSTFDAGVAILPAAFLMVLVAPRSAKLVEAKRSALHAAHRLRVLLLGFLTMLLLWDEGSAVLGGGARLRASSASASASRGPRPRIRSPARSRCSAPAWRRGRQISSATSAAPSCSRSSARCWRRATRRRSRRRSPLRRTPRQVSDSVEAQLTKSFAGARPSPGSTRISHERPDRQRGGIVPVGRSMGEHREGIGTPWRSAAALVFFAFPRKEDERRLLAEYHGGHEADEEGMSERGCSPPPITGTDAV